PAAQGGARGYAVAAGKALEVRTAAAGQRWKPERLGAPEWDPDATSATAQHGGGERDGGSRAQSCIPRRADHRRQGAREPGRAVAGRRGRELPGRGIALRSRAGAVGAAPGRARRDRAAAGPFGHLEPGSAWATDCARLAAHWPSGSRRGAAHGPRRPLRYAGAPAAHG